MTEAARVEWRRQFCALCGQLMFEFYRSPDGHFGLAGDVGAEDSPDGPRLRCETCGALYRLLPRVDSMGRPVARA